MVFMILDALAAGFSVDEILVSHPFLSHQAIRAVIARRGSDKVTNHANNILVVTMVKIVIYLAFAIFPLGFECIYLIAKNEIISNEQFY